MEKFETKVVQSCIFVEYGNGKKTMVMKEDPAVMFVGLSGQVLILNGSDEKADIKTIKPLLYTGINDIEGNEIYDCDLVKYTDTTGKKQVLREGIIQWREDTFYIVSEDGNVRRLSNTDKVVKSGNIYMQEDVEVVETVEE